MISPSAPAEGPAPALTGPVTLARLAEVSRHLDALPPGGRIDLSGVTALDTAGAWLLLRRRGAAPVHATTPQALLLATVAAALPVAPVPPRRPAHHRAGDGAERIGRATVAQLAAVSASLGFLGLVVARLGGTLVRPRRLRLTALVHHMQETGLNAVPIVALMGFLIGVVLAFQGATQLRQFGAEVFVVDLIAVSILRELGILLTAIIVAGRSASAFTAAIGSMKMREEIDAIRVLGLDPIDLLVLPRLLALVIVLPLLGLVANLSGLVGGALMAWVELGISPGQFRARLLEGVDAAQALVGLSKAPVFAAIIALVGCRMGLLVKGDAESLGQRTSQSVVLAIFLVILLDALFSVFFAVLGV
jgi:phospholipid/cholesterol/gamma-HCH transport system permease protein